MTPTSVEGSTTDHLAGALLGAIRIGGHLRADCRRGFADGAAPRPPGLHPRMAPHRAGPASRAVLEPPGLLALNYGLQTPAVAVAAHLVYGIALGLVPPP